MYIYTKLLSMINIFSQEGAQDFIHRINKLTPASRALWGKMSVDQMLAHVNVAYEMVYEADRHQTQRLYEMGAKEIYKKEYCK